MATAAERWQQALAGWAIPDDILAQAVESPWGFPVELFRAEDAPDDGGPSRLRAAEALSSGGVVLDVGCGGGAAGLALAPPADLLVGVDESEAMLAEMDRATAARGVEHQTICARWPDGEAAAPMADVVVCHHVAYNVAGLAGFAQALDAHARRRVVLELTARHPLTASTPLWRHFYELDRPAGPDAEQAAAVVAEAGIDVIVERWQRPARRIPRAALVARARRQLCLAPGCEAEVDAVMEPDAEAKPRQMATLWWDALAD